jgi:hypothetical protein
MNVEIGTEAVQFPEMEYINGIFVAVWHEKRKYLLNAFKQNKLKILIETLILKIKIVRSCSVHTGKTSASEKL